MGKLLMQVLSATWLFWLYSNTPIASIAGLSSPPRSLVVPTFQPVKAELNSLRNMPQWIHPLVMPKTLIEPNQVWLEVRLQHRRVTLYQGHTKIRDYPIAIGQSGWETPTGHFRVMHMQEQPDWIHPLTNERVPNGSVKNPLGRFWIGFWTDGINWVGFHGTPHAKSVGQPLSHGCLRMHDADIDELYYQVSTGTPVVVKR